MTRLARQPRLQATCERKSVYSETDAIAAAQTASAKTNEPINPYYCPFCVGWHIGHPHGYRRAKRVLRGDS